MRKVIRALHAEEQATSTSKETEKKLRLFERDDPLMKNSNYRRIDEQGHPMPSSGEIISEIFTWP